MTTREWAQFYARQGWHVFPIYGLTEFGECRCGEGGYPAHKNAGKHPRTPNGFKDASTSPDALASWFDDLNLNNVGIRTGRESGICVIDVDDLAAWQSAGITLPETLTARSGRGGTHYFFRYVDGLPGRNPWLPGVDFKSDGGYVVAPPSLHVSGNRYTWLTDPTMPPALLPDDVIASLRQARASSGASPTLNLNEQWREGERATKMAQVMGVLRRQRMFIRDDGTLDEDLFGNFLLMISHARCVPPLEDEEIRKLVASASRYTIRERDAATFVPTQWRGELDDLRQFAAQIAADPRTDLANALRLLDARQGEQKTLNDEWYVWAGDRWLEDRVSASDNMTTRALLVKNDIEREADLADDAASADALRDWARRQQSSGAVEATLKVASRLPGVITVPDDWDADPFILSVENGLVDLRDGSFRPRTKRDLVRKVAPVAFDPAATCPRWQRFLELSLPSVDLRNYMQRCVGYTLTGLTHEKALFLLCGNGDNGKSIFLEALHEYVFGPYAAPVPDTLLIARKTDSHPTDLAGMEGVRFAHTAELPQVAAFKSEILKRLTGGDRLTARRMHQDFFMFTPRLKLWIAVNDVPEIHDSGDAMWRRIKKVEFATVPQDAWVERETLMGWFSEERAGILNWALQGCADVLREGLNDPLEVILATQAERERSDWFTDFADRFLTLDPDAITPTDTLYAAYRQYAMRYMPGERELTMNSFGRKLGDRFPKTRVTVNGTSVRARKGLRLHDEVIRGI